MSRLDDLIEAVRDRADDYTWPLGIVDSASAELKEMRFEIARLKAKVESVEPMLAALRDTFKVFADPNGIYGHDNGCPGHHADSAEDGCRACFGRNCVEHVEKLIADFRGAP